MLDTAQSLAASGFMVFPCEGKKPVIKAWNKQATTNPAKVSSWWTQWPNANVGIHCINMIVVDVDVKNGGAIPEWCTKTFTVKTPSGGWHLYYAYGGGVPNSAGKVAQGVDIRSRNGYVIGPGSPGYEIVTTMRPEPAPPELIDASGVLRDVVDNDGAFEDDQDAAVGAASRMLEHQLVATEGQGGDAHTFAMVCKVRDMGVDQEHALDAMLKWNEDCQPPWDLAELQAKVDNAYRYAVGEAGSAVALDTDFTVGNGVSDTGDHMRAPPEVEAPLSQLTTIGDIDLPRVLNPEYIIKGWLPRSSNAMLFGEWGGGKTFNALHMAAHIAAGADWFGLRVRKGGVLYVGYEGGIGISSRFHALQLEYPDFDWDDMPLAWFMLNRALVNGGEGQEQVGAVLNEFRTRFGTLPCLVIFDPLRDALGGSDSDADRTTPYLKYTREMVKRMGCTVLTIHHPGHGDKDRARGDSGIEASMDTVIRLSKDAGTIDTKKQRDGGPLAFNYALKVVPLGVDEDGDVVQSCVVEQVSDNPYDPKLTDAQQHSLDELRKYADPNGYLRNSDIMDALPKLDPSERRKLCKVLSDKGYLVRDGAGHRLADPDSSVDIFS